MYFPEKVAINERGPASLLGQRVFRKMNGVDGSLALLELRYLLAGLLFNFRIGIPGDTNAESMAEVEFGGAQPKSGEFKLIFTPRHGSR